MEKKEREINEYLKNNYAYAKAYQNAKVYVSSEGKEVIPLRNIDPKKVKYKGIKSIKKEDGLIFEKSHFEITLPNGERTILTVDKDGKDISCNFIDENGKTKKFLLTPRMQKQIIEESINGKIQGKIDANTIKEALFPNTDEEMEKEIEKDTLIPKKSEQTVKKLKEKNPSVDAKEVQDSNIEGRKKEKSDKEDIEFPDEIRDYVEEIKQRDGAKLKHVLITKNPASITDQLTEASGIKDNGEPVYCLSFRSGDVASNDRVVFVQGAKVIDERRFDEDATNFMENYRTAAVVENVEDMDSKIYYTDLDGHTIVADMRTEPRDLKPDQKEELANILNKLENEEQAIRNSSMSLTDKIEASQKINDKRIKAFDEYGLQLSEIRSEIRADEEIGDDIQEDIEEKEDTVENIEDEYDPRDRNYNMNQERDERKKY